MDTLKQFAKDNKAVSRGLAFLGELAANRGYGKKRVAKKPKAKGKPKKRGPRRGKGLFSAVGGGLDSLGKGLFS